MVSSPSYSTEVAEIYIHINDVRSSVLKHAQVSEGVWIEIYQLRDRPYLDEMADEIAEEIPEAETPDLDSVIGSTKEVVPV